MNIRVILKLLLANLAAFCIISENLPCFSQTPATGPQVLPIVTTETSGTVSSNFVLLVQKAVAAAAKGDFVDLSPQMSSEMVALLTPQTQTSVKQTYFIPRGSIQKITILTQEQGASGITILSFTISLQKGILDGLLAVNQAGKIVQFQVAPDASKAAMGLVSYQSKVPVHLPFTGKWFVASGGPDPSHNRHTNNPTQRYAYDFNIHRNGLSHRGSGQQNTDYFAYGQHVIAPVSGTIVVRIDGVPENVPGQTNAYDVFGNYLIIDDGHKEWALLAHLQANSSPVHVGQHIVVGQEIGLCGNSGMSSEPHLHFHMQNSIITMNAAGLPITFQQFLQDGKSIRIGQLPAGATVQNMPSILSR